MEVDVNAEDEEPEEEDGEEETAGGAGYNYLLGMPLWSLTHEKPGETSPRGTMGAPLNGVLYNARTIKWCFL